jgi:uncharacterized protein YdiU (UPF0061 family)
VNADPGRHELAALAADAGLFRFDNSYARDLQGGYVAWQPVPPPAPRLLRLNRELADELGLDADALASPRGVALLSGAAVPAQAQPLAQAYAGHQFGGFSPQLGDGRALLLGELIDRHGRRRDIAFKGSGRTPFSRGGDGKAVLGPVLREYLVGEAMHALGIPTTRALAVVATGEVVQRETPLPGALLVRVASSHLRVGTFQYFAARGDAALLRRLADHAIARHDPALVGSEQPYLGLLRAVVERQAALVARWMGVGFIHGVMNTDNMTISGETIDYGPCAFIEAYDPRTVFSSIDHQGRYAYGNQPGIAQWNLTRFAQALLPLLHPDNEQAEAQATEVLHSFAPRFAACHLAVMRAKLGLDPVGDADTDRDLAADFLDLLHQHRVDFTLGFRRLRDAAAGDDAPLRALFGAAAEPLAAWLQRWRERSSVSPMPADTRLQLMARANPAYIARNHQVEAALAAAVNGDDLAPFERLLAVLQQPFDERAADTEFMWPAPPEHTASYRTFCGT